MGTRGLWGIRKDGVDKATFIQNDSFPETLGEEFARFCAQYGKDGLERLFDQIVLVNEMDCPSLEQYDYCKERGWTDLSPEKAAKTEWCSFLWRLQHNFDEYGKAIKDGVTVYMANGIYFIRNGLHCEFTYIADLDAGTLEFWTGYHEDGVNERYGKDDDCRWCCLMKKAFPFDILSDIRCVVEEMEHLAYED